MFSINRHVRIHIELMDNKNKKKKMKSLFTDRKFLFTYNDITSNNLHSGHDI